VTPWFNKSYTCSILFPI